MKFIIKTALWFMAALTLAALIAKPCAAQSSGGRPPRDTTLATREVERELENERKMRNSEVRTRLPGNESTDPRQTFALIREDFQRIQFINRELAESILRGGTLDLKFVAKSASDIRKRAERLKYNLGLPEAEDSVKRARMEVGAEPEQLRAALDTLGPLIVEFAHNPVFKDANVIDAKLAAKVRSDLEAIIELSGQVKKRSEQLHKAEQKSQ